MTPALANRDTTVRPDTPHGDQEASHANALPRHGMSWVARASPDGGIVRPRAFAVRRFTTKRNCVGRSTGRSSGLAPFVRPHTLIFGSPARAAFTCAAGYSKSSSFPVM